MRRFMICTLVFAIFACPPTLLCAHTQKKNVKDYWGRCTSTDSDGPLSGEAYIDVDIDYPDEPGITNAIAAFFFGYGISYEAYAKVKGKAPNNDYEGEYECYAWVPNDEEHKPREKWNGEVDEDVRAEDRKNLPAEGTDWAAQSADSELSSCTAWGDVNGSSPIQRLAPLFPPLVIAPPITPSEQVQPAEEARFRPAESHSAYVNAWNFNDPETHNAEHP